MMNGKITILKVNIVNAPLLKCRVQNVPKKKKRHNYSLKQIHYKRNYVGKPEVKE